MRSPHFVFQQPNVENTIPVKKYLSSSPEKFSSEEEDNLILYAGGESYYLEILENDPTVKLVVDKRLKATSVTKSDSVSDSSGPLGKFEGIVSLFVLNTCFLIWFQESDIGIEFPYQCITLHALQGDKLYLQVVSNEILKAIPSHSSLPIDYDLTVELTIRNVEVDIKSNSLFQDKNNSSWYSSSSVQRIYEAMSRCSANHFDDDEEAEESEPTTWYTGNDDIDRVVPDVPDSWLNQGDADDLGEQEPILEGEAGMDVDVGYGSIAGTVRRNSENAEVESKRKRK
ncbi:protein Lot5p [[Candida] railenensis]|uniref:Protein LOT5 n=1 Tax=[Candida] railenensis TaxID=45579 RepID=A0A9P0QW67_9ASCO|nr:protein Lot5p [[Candida] railenensis]